jgi:alkylation response protein AidB-like acyl-CoA dehydrogenase
MVGKRGTGTVRGRGCRWTTGGCRNVASSPYHIEARTGRGEVAGSDLAGVSTHAVRDENDWVINGQKVWNTSAHHADFGILVARTDWSVPKHQGITYFVLPMHQPGVEVRPLRQMNGHASFNEVFISDARIPAEYVVGSVNEGWSATLTTLLYERRLGMMRPAVKRHSTGCAVREAQVESDRHFATYSWYPQRAGRADLGDRFVRQELARLISMQKIDRWTTDRVRVARLLGRVPGPEASIGKLAMSNLARQASRVHTIVGGPHAMLSGPESLLGGVIAEVLVSVPAQSIAGGTDEIQRDILGEKVLGLPREPVSDAERPFREVLRSS